MKTMTCEHLGGACDQAFQANSFEEMAEMAKRYGKEMFQKSDVAHLQAMSAIQELMQKPDTMKEWFKAKYREFDEVPED
jgi:hypothetical protein